MKNNFTAGAFLISRSLIKSSIFREKPPAWLKIWIYLLCRVHHTDTEKFQRGENLFTYQEIQLFCRVTRAQVEKCLKHLKKETQIVIQKAMRGMIIKVLNYEEYQDIENYRSDIKSYSLSDKKERKKRQKSDKKATLKSNNENNENNVIKKRKGPVEEKFFMLAQKFFRAAGARYLDLCPKFVDRQKELITSWAEELEKIHRLDEVSPENIDFLLTWLFESDSESSLFWRKQIYTPKKLRQKNKDGIQYWRLLADKIRSELQTTASRNYNVKFS